MRSPFHEASSMLLNIKKTAPAGNRTRVCTVAGYYSTTRPLVLCQKSNNRTSKSCTPSPKIDSPIVVEKKTLADTKHPFHALSSNTFKKAKDGSNVMKRKRNTTGCYSK
ncbi:unnamed protein product [Sphenostylis stenocarpa]|uniref:Uncharacterized protein n=1 Tax=Sphenostylis stenocarpa TaxID=92480 RepID=A0AA86SJ86_9FABA|nr:unnamed protein product [Sphenostylis stenocarpa]